MNTEYYAKNILKKRSTKLCRICLTENIKMSKCVFDNINSSCIASMVMLCARVQIACQDGLPDIICAQCLGDLESANSFRLRCELADSLLRESRSGSGQPQAPISVKKEAFNDEWIEYKFENNVISVSFVKPSSCELTDLVSLEKMQDQNEFNFSSKTQEQNSCGGSGQRKAPTSLKEEAFNEESASYGLEDNVKRDSLLRSPACEPTDLVSHEKSPSPSKLNFPLKTQENDTALSNNIILSTPERNESDIQRTSANPNIRNVFSCTECSFSAGHQFLLTSHVRYVHRKTRQKHFECDVCHKPLPNSHYMKIHKMFCSADVPFKSNFDYFGYASILKMSGGGDDPARSRELANIRRAKARLAKNRSSKHMCEMCGKRLSSRKILESHIKRHLNIRDFKCSFCKRCFVDQWDLNFHAKMHTDPKKFECDICGHKTRLKRGLISHLMIHTGEKNVKCELCDYRCINKPALKMHMVSHSDERRFSCPICDAKFKVNSKINKHMLRIHKIVYRVGDYSDRRLIKQ